MFRDLTRSARRCLFHDKYRQMHMLGRPRRGGDPKTPTLWRANNEKHSSVACNQYALVPVPTHAGDAGVREMRGVYIGTRTRHPQAPPGAQTYADRQQQVFGLHSGGRQRQHWWCNIAALESSFMRGMSRQAFFSLVSGQQCLPPLLLANLSLPQRNTRDSFPPLPPARRGCWGPELH